MKRIALILMLLSWSAVPNAYAIMAGSGTGIDSGTSSSYGSTSYDSGTGSSSYDTGTGSSSYDTGSGTGTGSSYSPGDISMGGGSGTGSGSGCTYGCTVPEPETFFLMGIGLMGLYLARRRK